ncbi:hypothetical protein GCM10027162_50820 [Streptomyces incanus]
MPSTPAHPRQSGRLAGTRRGGTVSVTPGAGEACPGRPAAPAVPGVPQGVAEWSAVLDGRTGTLSPPADASIGHSGTATPRGRLAVPNHVKIQENPLPWQSRSS